MSLDDRRTVSAERNRGLRVHVLRKLHVSWTGGSLDNGLNDAKRKYKLKPRNRNSGGGLHAKAESKRSKSLSPLRSRGPNKEADRKMTTESVGLNHAATATTPLSGLDQQKSLSDMASPDITITSASSGQPDGNGTVSCSESEASAESDQQGVVVTFRKKTKEMNGEKSGSEARISSTSSETVSIAAPDRQSSGNGRKSSQRLTSDAPTITVQAGNGAAGKMKQERKCSSSSSASPTSNGGSSVGVGTVASSGSVSQAQAQQAQSAAPAAGEKTRLQSAATQLKNFLAPNYKSRSEEFKKLFKPAENDKFVIDYSCAVQREILVHGRMYVSQHLLCFYANIFKWETTIVIRLKDINNITKEKTAKFIPNALQISTKTGEKLFFTSFSMRDKTYMMIFRIWQNALMDRIMHPAELYSLEHQGYDEVEFSCSDHEAEDALTALGDESPSGRKRVADGECENLRRVAASAPHSGSVPPLTGLGTVDSVAESEDGSGRSRSGLEDIRNGYSEANARKVARMITATNSQDTAATTPAEEYTESENDGEINCPCSSHNGKELLNGVYPISVDQLFLLLFTDSVFFRKLHEDRKTTDVALSDWHVDKTTGTKSRQITYIVALNHSIGPKTCAVTEKQLCTGMSKPGQLYVMKSEVSNSGIPYSDAFSVAVQYCLSRVSANQCRIRVHASIVYKKNCWGIVKSFIDKNALAGMEDFFTDLDTHLHAECARFGLTNAAEEPEQDEGADSMRRRQSSMASRAEATNASPARRRTSTGASYPLLPSEIETIAKGILFVLILMLLLNAALFYKLWYFESEAERGSFETSIKDFERILQKSEVTPSEWLNVLQRVRFAEKKQLAKWLDELDHAVKHLATVQTSLEGIRKQITMMQKDFSINSNLRVSLSENRWEEKEP